ncbi:MAG: Yip1 family protein [Planctomycetota bacterium]|nr:Yip1 family protein [Planctomycetota bacterium]
MNCKSCDYPLWNLRGRECPECGTPFRPSDFDFTLNAVRFCCPHCGQDYYGTGDRGHLVPDSFACVSCARPITMDECLLLPTAGVREEQTRPDDMPWLERRRHGVISAWFKTIGRAMVTPGRLMDAIPAEGPSGFVFGAVTTSIFLLVSVAPLFVFILVMGAGVGGRPSMNAVAGIAGGGGATILGAIVGIIMFLGLWIVCTHGTLRITGGAPYPIKRTCQALCYSSGANVLTALPCLGMYFGFLFVIWWIVAACIMVARGHRISGGRATLAVLALPILLAVVGGGWLTYGIVTAMNTINAANPGGTGTTTYSPAMPPPPPPTPPIPFQVNPPAEPAPTDETGDPDQPDAPASDAPVEEPPTAEPPARVDPQ